MKVELKNVKFSEFASEETNCFEASVWVDGVRAGTARNQGTGGATHIEPQSLRDKLDAYAATLPPLTGFGEPMQQDAELLVDELLTTWFAEKELTRAMKGKFLFTRAGKPGIFATTKIPTFDAHFARGEAYVRTFMSKLGPDKILNFMPYPEALALWRTQPSA